jgi:hypothetical protein
MSALNTETSKSEDYAKGFGEVELDCEEELIYEKRLREEPGPRHVRLRRNAAGLLTMPPHISATPENGMRQPWTGNAKVDKNLFIMDRALEIRLSGKRMMSRAQNGNVPIGNPSAGARAGKPIKPLVDRRKLQNVAPLEDAEDRDATDRQLMLTTDRRTCVNEKRDQQMAAHDVRKIIDELKQATAANIEEVRSRLKQAQVDQLEYMGPVEAQKVREEADQALSQAQARLQV